MRLDQPSVLHADGDGLEVLSLLATRICHDFAGALGTLAGTLELLGEPGDEAAALSQELAGSLVARVRLLRAAWGGGAGPLDATEIAAMAQGLPGIERLRLDLSALSAPLEAHAARLALCLLLVAPGCLKRGGDIALAHAGADGVSLRLSGGEWPAALAQAPDWLAANSPRSLPVPLAALTARALGWALVLAGDTVTAIPA